MSAAPGWFDEPARLVRPFLPQIHVGADADLPELTRALLAVGSDGTAAADPGRGGRGSSVRLADDRSLCAGRGFAVTAGGTHRMRAVEPAGRWSVRPSLPMPPRRRGVRPVDTLLVVAEAFIRAIVLVPLVLRDRRGC